jgi:hypothetical protein
MDSLRLVGGYDLAQGVDNAVTMVSIREESKVKKTNISRRSYRGGLVLPSTITRTRR